MDPARRRIGVGPGASAVMEPSAARPFTSQLVRGLSPATLRSQGRARSLSPQPTTCNPGSCGKWLSAPPGNSYVPAVSVGCFDRLGSWGDLLSGGVVDRHFLAKEAERRKKEIDRSLEAQVAQVDSDFLEQRAMIQQQAEYQTRMAEQQIDMNARQQVAHVMRHGEMQSLAAMQRADMERRRLGSEAARALAHASDRAKAAILYDAMHEAEDLWQKSQRELMEKKVVIDAAAAKRTHDVDGLLREAMSRVYVAPTQGAMLGLPAPQWHSERPGT